MGGSILVRAIFGALGMACLVVGLLPRSSERTGGSVAADRTASARLVRIEFSLGLPSSPLYRSATVTSDTVNRDVESQLVSRHNRSSTSRVEFLSWSAALVAVGAVLLVAALRPRAPLGGGTTPAAGGTGA